MRPIWKGHISFGLVSVPVSVYPAEERRDLQFHLLDSRNHARVRYERVNAETGEEVPWDQVVKGYEYDGGNYVIVGEEELKRAAPEATQTIDIEAFVPIEQIDQLYFDKPYYLEPAKKGEKAYALLREVLRSSGRAGIAKVVIRTRQYIAALVARGDALVLNLLRYQQELRAPDELDLPTGKVGKLTKQEMSMAKMLVDSMSADWDPSQYHDEYRDALTKWIEKRIASGDVEHAADVEPVETETPRTINLMEALQKSLKGKGKSGNGRAGRKSAASPRRPRKTARRKAG